MFKVQSLINTVTEQYLLKPNTIFSLSEQLPQQNSQK